MTMAEREQPFQPLSRRESVQRIGAAFAIILLAFVALLLY